MRGLIVDEGSCIGCRACASVCPLKYISLTDEGGYRVIRFPPSCEEDCILCSEICPQKAIAFREVGQAAEMLLSFTLSHCARCRRPFAPEKALDNVALRIVEITSSGAGDWLNLCWSCRRMATAQGLLGTRPNPLIPNL